MLRRLLLSVCLLYGTMVHGGICDSVAQFVDTSNPVATIKVIPRSNVNAVAAKSDSMAEGRAKYIGFNTSHLLQQILPFNAIPLQQNMYALTYRRYSSNKGWRTAIGMHLSDLEELQWFAVRVDYDKRKKINNRWLYNRGVGLGFEMFENPENNNFFFSNTETDLVVQFHWGVEYQVNSVISLSLETQAMLRGGSNSGISVRPPTIITAHFRLE